MNYKVPFQKKSKDYWLPRLIWLRKNLGRSGNRWCIKKDYYFFLHEKDMMIFLLKHGE